MTNRNREPVIALLMVGRSTVPFRVLGNWIEALRRYHWPGPSFIYPEIYAAGAWIGVVPVRNIVTYRALQDRSWTHLLSIDADHIVHHLVFQRAKQLARDPRARVVGGAYYGRDYPFEVQAWGERVEDGVLFVRPELLVPGLQGDWTDIPLDWLHYPVGGGAPLLRVAGVGTGCMLIERTVLEELAERRGAGNVWHADSIPWERQVAMLEAGQSFSGVMTEDINFCLDVAAQLDVQVWLDLDQRMETGHLGEEPRDRRHYLASHQLVIREGSHPLLPSGYEFVPEKPALPRPGWFKRKRDE